MAEERAKLLADFAKLCTQHETSTANATADVRTMFAAQQKLFEQNVAAWQSREQHAAHSLDRIAKRFEVACTLIGSLATIAVELYLKRK